MHKKLTIIDMQLLKTKGELIYFFVMTFRKETGLSCDILLIAMTLILSYQTLSHNSFTFLLEQGQIIKKNI